MIYYRLLSIEWTLIVERLIKINVYTSDVKKKKYIYIYMH